MVQFDVHIFQMGWWVQPPTSNPLKIKWFQVIQWYQPLQGGPLPVIISVMGPDKWPKINGFHRGYFTLLGGSSHLVSGW